MDNLEEQKKQLNDKQFNETITELHNMESELNDTQNQLKESQDIQNILLDVFTPVCNICPEQRSFIITKCKHCCCEYCLKRNFGKCLSCDKQVMKVITLPNTNKIYILIEYN